MSHVAHRSLRADRAAQQRSRLAILNDFEQQLPVVVEAGAEEDGVGGICQL